MCRPSGPIACSGPSLRNLRRISRRWRSRLESDQSIYLATAKSCHLQVFALIGRSNCVRRLFSGIPSFGSLTRNRRAAGLHYRFPPSRILTNFGLSTGGEGFRKYSRREVSRALAFEIISGANVAAMAVDMLLNPTPIAFFEFDALDGAVEDLSTVARDSQTDLSDY